MEIRNFWAALQMPDKPLKPIFIGSLQMEGTHLYLTDKNLDALKQKVDAFSQELLIWENGEPKRINHDPEHIVFYITYKQI